MANPTYVKCGNNVFELQDYSPKGSNFRFNMVQCSQCGAVVGVVDYYNIGQLIHDLAAKLGVKI